jgi:hypothetical protein
MALRIGRRRSAVVGRVLRVRARSNGSWRIRLIETGGALAAAEIRPSHPVPLPPRHARISIHGRIRFDPEHQWYTIDPVEEWKET